MACTSGRIAATASKLASSQDWLHGRGGRQAGQPDLEEVIHHPQTPGEIARRLGLATPTVTRAATGMEAAGLLRREPHPGDRRLVRLLLTERGRSLEGVIAAETDKLTERALATFGPAERESVIRALAAIRRNLTGA